MPYYNYRPYELEKIISLYYVKKGVVCSDDINEKDIANYFGIYLTYTERRSYSHEEGDFKMINIDSRLLKEMQREHFFHELGHVLRHCGSQLIMPKLFIDLQEYDSKRFTKYAAIPYHMIMKYDFNDPYLIHHLSTDFKVNKDLCNERVENIKRKCFAESLYAAESALIYNY